MTPKMKELYELLDDFDAGMLSTRMPQGFISSRPMTLQKPRPDRALWMIATKDTSSARNIATDSDVNLSFRRSSDQAWISIAGKARLNDNMGLINELWQKDWSTWIPDERRDQAVLIEIEPFQIDFWEPELGALSRMFELAKASLTDSTPDLPPVKTLHINDAQLATALCGSTK